jgi:acyl-CoA reductase-like NAD-dependent aldehyde dehydrogenase
MIQNAIDRVGCVVRAASTLELDETLIHAIARSSGLSVEGVRLALERHLETDPADEDVRHLVSHVAHADRVHVLLSSTVFVSALRAIAVAWAAAPSVVVRPSHRDPHFATALVRAIDDPGVTLAPDLDVSQIDRGEIHVHGRMETIEHVRRGARPGVTVRAHGPGMGVAIVGEDADLDAAAADLADDIVVFDQRGCLSPRLIFALGDAGGLASALSEALDSEVPLGTLTEEERAESARFIQALAFSGVVKASPGGVVGVGDGVFIPPTGRHVQIIPSTVAMMRERIEKLAPHITAVGLSAGIDHALAPVDARVSPLGMMQRPPLDGPVDRRRSP